MPKKFILLFVSLCFHFSYSVTWTPDQLAKANTAKNQAFLTKIEKEAIMYINLARLFPKEFVKNELQNYFGPAKYGGYLKNSKYIPTLKTKLNSMQTLKALKFDNALYENAKCFSKEQGESGKEGHERKICKKLNFAECCSYGMPSGKDVALQWLIDHDVPSLGHRINCLNANYTKIGLSEHSHKKWGTCSIAELI